MNGSSTDPLIGRLVDGRYQVRSRIARGGMATVYLATDLRLERRVAIKVMHGHLADDSQFKERFIQEARSAARLAHPNVVNVFDQGQDSDMAYLVMEYLPGITLRDLLQDHGRLTTEQSLDILEAVLSGLAAAHKAGIVHRDLKPENVLLADDGRIKIGDFGLARAATANTATGAALLGTIAYLSPELVTRGLADTRSDIYAVGIMTYEMLTGEQPFKGEQPMQIAYQHANDSVPPPSGRNPRVSAELDELVLWATAREPDERPRDARVLLEQVHATRSMLDSALDSAAGTQPQRTMVLTPARTAATADTQMFGTPAPRHRTGPVLPAAAATLATRTGRRRARGWWLLGLVLLLAGAAGGTGWYYGVGPGSQATVPSVAGSTLADARATLTERGFVVAAKTRTETSPTVEKGLVTATNPPSGRTVASGASITLIVSSGPAMLPLPDVAGSPVDEARAAITDAGFTVGDNDIEQFDGKIAKGTVLGLLDSSGKPISADTTYPEQRELSLLVSAGALPPVKNLSLDDAIAALKDVGLTAGAGQAVYSSEVDEGRVISIDREKNADGVSRVFRVGDSNVLLTVSRGPEPVEVPQVEGLSWLEAKKILTDAGFRLSYNPGADLAPALVTVKKTDPRAGATVPRGTEIEVRFTN